MIPQDKAKEIYYKFLNKLLKDSELVIKKFVREYPIQAAFKQTEVTCEHAKQCALISVDLIIDALDDVHEGMTGENIKYWQDVKKEMEKL